MQHKTLSRVRVKDADLGQIEAVFSTLGVVDSDGDVTVKGAFTDGASVVISAYGHRSWDGDLPLGKGTIREDGNEVVLDGEFFMGTTHGRDAFLTVKALSESDLQEWSYSLEEVESERGEVDGKRVNIIKRVTVKEVSPVLRGAGVNTRTLVAKSASERKQLTSQISRMLSEAGSARWSIDLYGWVYLDDFDVDEGTAVFVIVDYAQDRRRIRLQVDFTRTDTSVELGDTETEVEYTTLYLPKSTKFSHHADAALRNVSAFTEQATSRIAQRVAEGKSIDEQRDALDQLMAELEPLRKALDTTPSEPSENNDLHAEWLRSIAILQRIEIPS